MHVHVDDVTLHSKGITTDDLLTDYADVFSGVGMFEKEYDIEVDPSVRPVIQAPRMNPFAKYDLVKLGAYSRNQGEAKRVTAAMPSFMALEQGYQTRNVPDTYTI